MKGSKRSKSFVSLLLAFALVLTLIPVSYFGFSANAEEVTPPAHSKTLTDNGDGTYNLNLSVTGSSKSSETKNKANVMIVLDVSGSMGYTSYTANATGNYGIYNGSYFQLYKQSGTNLYQPISGSENYTGTVYRVANRYAYEYTGQRYSRTTRLNVAKNAMKSLINSLASNNSSPTDDTIEISYMTFSDYGGSASYWYSGNNMSGLITGIDGLRAYGGTNWDDALHKATEACDAKKKQQPDENIYYIFVTDGDPTYYMNDGHTRRGGDGNSTTSNETNAAYAEADKVNAAGYYFFGIGAFGNVDRMKTLSDRAGGAYYSATDESALNNAFASVISAITNAENFQNVKITDGITEATSSVVLMDGADASDYIYTIKDAGGNEYKIELSDGGTIATINGGTTDVTLTDSVGTSLELKIGGAFPAAKKSGNGVEWDLSSLGQLLNNFTYTVSFKVWPSQEAYDTLAGLLNGTIKWEEVDQSQYVKLEGGDYGLKTNTKANVSFDYVSTEDGKETERSSGTAKFTEAPAMPLTATQMDVEKKWVGNAPDNDDASVTLELYVDNEKSGTTIKLNKKNQWKGSVAIAPGLRVNGEELEKGHDYVLKEVGTDGFAGYRYEFSAKTVHPMLVDSASQIVDDLNQGSQLSSIEATNTRKSTLSIHKSVTDLSTDRSADANQLFTYEITVNDGLSDDVWFSIGDGTQHTVVEEDRVSGATAEKNEQGEATGYFSTESGKKVTVKIKAGENIYFTNLPVGSTYDVKEINVPKGYVNTAITNNGGDATNEVPSATGKIAAGNTAYQVGYTNTYDAVTISDGTNNALQVTKKVEGLDAIEQFAFTITPDADTQMAIQAGDIVVAEGANQVETTTEGNIKKDGTETVSFGKYTFYAEGVYKFTAKETTTTKAGGWTYDASEKEITVTIAKDDSGKLQASVEGNNPTFTNSYKAAPVDAEIPVEKILSVSEGLNAPNIANKYTFILAAVNGAPMPAAGGEVVTNPAANGGKATFGKITYTAPGTYKYTIKESGKVDGVANDIAATKEVSVVVTDRKDGTMTAVVNGDQTTTFTNKYEVGEATADIRVTKVLKADADLNAPDIKEEFTFTLKAVDGAPMPAEGSEVVKNPAADGGTASFGTIKFTEPGTYKYEITEIGSVAGVTNDADSTKEITVEVKDNGNGTMTATANGGSAVTFTNEYKVTSTTATIPVTKKVTTSDPTLTAPAIAEAYEFTLTANDGAPEPSGEGSNKVKNPAADGGTANFGEITFTKPGTYTYTITEAGEVSGVTNDAAAETGKKVTVVVTDNGKGTLSAVVQGADAGNTNATTFTNTYSVKPVAENIPVTKVLAKEDASLQAPDITGKYTFTLTAVKGAPTTDASGASITTSYTNPDVDGGSVTFGAISFTKPGTYTYTVAESGSVEGITNDSASSKNVVVIVTDQGDGTLSTEVKGADGNGRSTTFTNTYSVNPTTATIPVTKALDVPAGLTPNSIKEKFTFTIAAAEESPEGTPPPATTSVKNPEDNGGSTDFGTITFTKPGTYTYNITESGSADGVTNDTESTKTVTVVVTDNQNGTLTATVTGADGEGNATTFTNSYKVEKPVNVVIPVAKEVSAEDGLTPPDIAEKFTFTIAAAEGSPEGTPLPETKSVTNPEKDGGVASFDAITFDQPGTYIYAITESGKVAGIQNDTTSTKTVVVTVTDNGDGTLSAVATSTRTDPVTFTNTYEVKSTTTQIPVEKILSVPEGLTAPDIKEKYTFTLTATDGTPMPEVTELKNPDADGGSMNFGEITYDKPGTYTYTVTETGTVKGISNDSVSTRTVSVVVTDNSDGTLTAVANGGEAVKFTNSYSVGEIKATIPVKKILDVEDGLNAPDITGEFIFTLSAEEGTPMPEVTEITNPAATGGSTSFAAIKYTEPGTYTYTVTESGSVDGVTNDQSAQKTVEVVVTDNSDGTLSAVVNDGEEVVFKNTYSVTETKASIPVEKVLDAEEGLNAPDITGEYTFTLSAEDGAPLPEETALKNPDADGGSMSFGEITFKKPGIYTYKVTETGNVDGITNDPAAIGGKTVTIVVTDNSDGILTAEVKGADNEGEATTFTNTYTVESIDAEIPVTKILDVDADLTAPDITGAFTFTLKDADGEVVDTMTNPDADGGKASFEAITYDKPGTYTYTVEESGSVAGITNDQTAEKEVSVVVTDNGNGTLSAQINYGNAIEYTNTYTVASTTAQIPVEKVLEVPEGLTAPDITEAYTFTLSAEEGTPMPDETEIKNPDADGGKANFAAITYSKPGTYTYTVTETGTVKGISNDSVSTRTVSVVVTDNSDGTLTAVANGGEAVKFTNSYSVGEIKAAIPVTKTLNAASGLNVPDITEAYTFTLAAKGEAPMPEVTEITNPAADGGTRSFDAITYTKPGTYTYTVTESGKVDGIENDAENSKTVTVVVTDNSDGTLNAVVNDGAAVEFTNTYNVSETVANIPVEKILSVPEGLTAGSIAGKFTFTLSAEDETPMPAAGGEVVTNPDANGGVAVFDTITYTEPGTYTYTVTESGSAGGVTNDQNAAKTVQVVVTDNGKGALVAVVNGGANLTFTNSYEVEPVEVSLPVQKELYVPAGLEGPADISGEFTFTIAGASEETPLPETRQIVNPAADGGVAEFGTISYTRPGTYVYTVTESGNVSGVTNDAQAANGKTVTVQVTDNGNGTLSAVASTTAEKPLTFTNIYSVDPTTARITAVKKLKNADLAQGAFNFELLAKTGGAPMPASSNATNDANGTVVFGEITFSQPGTYEYTVRETAGDQKYYKYSEDTYGITITVTDNQNGTLSAVVSGDGRNATFTNTYLAESDEVILSAEKRVNGDAATANIFEFTITADDGGALPAETRVTNNGGSVSFEPIKFTSDIFAEDEKPAENAAEEKANEETAETGKTDADQSADEAKDNANSADAASGNTGVSDTEDTQNVENAENAEKVEDNAQTENESSDAGVTENANEGVSAVDSNLTSRSDNATYKFIRTADVRTSEVIQSSETVEDAAEAETSMNAEATPDTGGKETKERVRTFHYTISEVVGNAPGYTYDTRTQGVTVTVTDNGDGTLSTSVEYDNEDVSFNNLYHAEGEATIEVKKVLNVIDGDAQLSEGEFRFGLFDGDEQIAEASNDADGNVTFTVNYDEKDGGQHVYTVRELVKEKLTGYTYDTATIKTAIVDVTDNGKGTMETNVMYPDQNMTFTNTYEPRPTDITITGTKVLEGRSLTEGEFAFTLTDEDGKTVATGTNDAEGTITFSKIPISRTGVYKYTATETSGSESAMIYDSNKITFTVEVVDVHGELTVESITPEQGEAVFTNTYDPKPGVKIEKHATNVPLGQKYNVGDTIQYKITVKNDGNVPLTDVLVKDELTGNEWTLAILQPGEEKSYEASYVVKKADAEKGDVLNEATVTAKTPDPKTPELTDKDDDTEIVKKPANETPTSNTPTRGGSARTGDDSDAMLWIVLLGAAIATGAGVVVIRKKAGKE